MKPEAQRIAIAEACGWTGIRMSNRWEYSDDPANPQDWSGLSPMPHLYGHIPDYLSDLNAMHEAENTLSQEQFFKYCDNLHPVMDAHTECHNSTLAWRIRASAPIRAEAFLRTIGKWDDSK